MVSGTVSVEMYLCLFYLLLYLTNFDYIDHRSIFVMLECRLLDTEVDGINPGISMLCP